jgi:biopolymer transport protein ExbB/TolQ
MIEFLDSILGLIQEGSFRIMFPLIVVCLAMWATIVERSLFLFGSARTLLWPSARRRLRELESSVTDCLEDYVEGPTEENRTRLLQRCWKLRTPYARFFFRALGEGLPGPAWRDLQFAEANLKGCLEIERGLGMIAVLAKAAPLLGLLGTVVGMIQTFQAMMLASSSDPRALASGISIALIATEVGLVVSLPGVISTTWLSRRAQSLEEEMHLASMRLKQLGPELPREVAS